MSARNFPGTHFLILVSKILSERDVQCAFRKTERSSSRMLRMSLSARRGYRGIQSPCDCAPSRGQSVGRGWSVTLAASKSPCMTLRAFAQDEPPLWML